MGAWWLAKPGDEFKTRSIIQNGGFIFGFISINIKAIIETGEAKLQVNFTSSTRGLGRELHTLKKPLLTRSTFIYLQDSQGWLCNSLHFCRVREQVSCRFEGLKGASRWTPRNDRGLSKKTAG